MIGASKILTVSYGTFSCTLEGFDEPFNTMKGIAEYFRDLAADDRYFGAEPPTPDAAMLHRIAEREIHRRVEAKIQDNGVILRASAAVQDNLPATVTTPAARLQPSNQGTAPVESVAAKLMRIRAAAVADTTAVAPAVAMPEAEPQPDQPTAPAAVPAADRIPGLAELSDQGDDGTIEGLPDVLAGTAAAQSPDADDADGMLDKPVSGDAGAVEDWLDESAPEATRFEASSAEPAPADDEDARPDLATLHDGHDTAPAHDGATALADPVPAMAEPIADVEAEGPAQPVDLAGDDDPDIDDRRASAQAADVTPTTLTDLFPEDDLDDAAGPAARAGTWQDDEADDLDLDEAATAPAAAGDLDDEDDDLAAALAEEPLVLAEPAVRHADLLPAPAPRNPSAMEKIQRARARVIKIHRAVTPDAVAAAGSTGLTAEAEAALSRALADDRTDAAAESAPPPVQPNRPVRRPVAVDAAEPAVDASVNRLMAQTATEMDVPEQRRRRSAIEHLKAAVAATLADRRVGGPLPPSEEELADPYRSDLSEMVGTGSPAPVARSTPLVLVSEQRIDRKPAQAGADASRGMVRPRRVGTAPLALRDVVMDDDDADDEDDDAVHPVDPRGFADFAARLGARSLPDLLEAAAAYTAVVEGRPHFSRPHLMRQVGTVVTDVDFTRETGLRGFGTLLRMGRILRVKRGQYALAEGSRYMTDMAGE